MRDHTVVVGYGTKGRSAVRALLDDGADRPPVVAVDNDPDHIADAGDDGIAAIVGDGTRADVLRRAGSRPPPASSSPCRATTPRCS